MTGSKPAGCREMRQCVPKSADSGPERERWCVKDSAIQDYCDARSTPSWATKVGVFEGLEAQAPPLVGPGQQGVKKRDCLCQRALTEY